MCETLQFLDIMCGSTTGGLGLLGLYINEDNVGLITQTLETLTEYCQGPCHENQVRQGPAAGQCGRGDVRSQWLGWRDGGCRLWATRVLRSLGWAPHCLLPDLHRDARVQWHRHHHRADPQ